MSAGRAARAARAAIEARPLPPFEDLDDRVRLAVERRVRFEGSALAPRDYYERARAAQAASLVATDEAAATAAAIRRR